VALAVLIFYSIINYKRSLKNMHLNIFHPHPGVKPRVGIACILSFKASHSSTTAAAMAKNTGKCGNCDCAAGTCAKEDGGKCGNCDCAAGTCAKESGGKCGNCDCAAGTCAKE